MQATRLLLKRKAGTLPTLQYLFEFLNAYDFKYFETDFIDGGQRLYNAYDLRLVGRITDRFGINLLILKMAHIFNCLKQRLFEVGASLKRSSTGK